jgi:hypothetical protein
MANRLYSSLDDERGSGHRDRDRGARRQCSRPKTYRFPICRPALGGSDDPKRELPPLTIILVEGAAQKVDVKRADLGRRGNAE